MDQSAAEQVIAGLDEEREEINQQLGRDRVDFNLSRRRAVIETKLDQMRSGKEDWYVYRYLGGEGFLPGYAFPQEAVHLSFDMDEDELTRAPSIALVEYAPSNFIYFNGQRFEVTQCRPRTRLAGQARQNELDTEPVLICPACLPAPASCCMRTTPTAAKRPAMSACCPSTPSATTI